FHFDFSSFFFDLAYSYTVYMPHNKNPVTMHRYYTIMDLKVNLCLGHFYFIFELETKKYLHERSGMIIWDILISPTLYI
ncbi:hypothetical protein, partial [Clostridium sp.]|uniref:hypothetical protein n=1 Tax=Clostridium sp. TaxID=1506 RepID=UPI0035A00864